MTVFGPQNLTSHTWTWTKNTEPSAIFTSNSHWCVSTILFWITWLGCVQVKQTKSFLWRNNPGKNFLAGESNLITWHLLGPTNESFHFPSTVLFMESKTVSSSIRQLCVLFLQAVFYQKAASNNYKASHAQQPWQILALLADSRIRTKSKWPKRKKPSSIPRGSPLDHKDKNRVRKPEK